MKLTQEIRDGLTQMVMDGIITSYDIKYDSDESDEVTIFISAHVKPIKPVDSIPLSISFTSDGGMSITSDDVVQFNLFDQASE